MSRAKKTAKKKARAVPARTARAPGSPVHAPSRDQSTAIAVRPATAISTSFDTSAHKRLLQTWLKAKAPGTVAHYVGALQHLARFLADKLELDLVHPQDALAALIAAGQGAAHELLVDWMGTMIETGIARATVRWRLAAVRSFVELANQSGLCPWALRTKPPKMRRGGMAATVNDSKSGRAAWLRLRGHLEGSQQPPDVRDLAMFRVMHDCALRRFEVCSLDAAHVDLEQLELSILGKGRDEREVVPLHPNTARAVEAWLRLRGAQPGPLFTNNDRSRKGDGRLTPNGLSAVFASRRRELGIELRPHDLRRLGITRVLDRNGGDIAATLPFSRHRNPQTLVRYDLRRREIPRAQTALAAEDD